MELYQHQQFDFLLLTAVDRYVERLVQRNEGASNALHKIRQNPQAEGIWLNQFVEAIFQDFLLDDVAGTCFILQSLAQQTIAAPTGDNVEKMLMAMAKEAFAGLLRRKTEEFLEQQAGLYGEG